MGKIFLELDLHLSQHVPTFLLYVHGISVELLLETDLTVLSWAVGLAGWRKSTGASRGSPWNRMESGFLGLECQHCRVQDADQATLPDIYDLRSRCFRRSLEGQAAVPSLIANAWNI